MEPSKLDISPQAKGKRISYLIAMSGLSMVDLAEGAGVAYSSLKQWKLGIRNINAKNAEKIAKTLLKKGIICSPQWILGGEGDKPFYSDTNRALKPANTTKIEASDKQEMALFEENHINPIFFEINDDLMAPILKKGYIVAGDCLDPDKLIRMNNKLCIVEAKDEGLFCRYAKRLKSTDCFLFFTASPLATKNGTLSIKEKRILKAAPVSRIWIRE